MERMRDRRKILLVDGDAHSRTALTKAFQERYQVVEALDGEMAIELLALERDFSLVLLQCELFETSGFDVLTALHARRIHLLVPVVAIGEPVEKLKAISMGALTFISKPVEPKFLACQVENLMEMLYKENDIDLLTGLYTRQAFLRETGEMLRANPQRGYDIAYLNIRRFKAFNDLFGRRTGDQVLMNLANVLRERFRESTVGRVGADHFMVCCPREQLNLEDFPGCAAAVTRGMQIKYDLRLVAGVYEVEDPALPVEQMCDWAQTAMDQVAESSVNRCAVYNQQLRERVQEEREITSDMEEALATGQFQVYLQPIYSLTTQRPISAEALVRWYHPVKGILRPNQFIPLFERNGFIRKLDAYIWETVFRYLAEFKARGYPDFPISANVSRLDLYSTDLCERVIGLAKQYDVDPSLFRVEVTESAYMDNPVQLLESIRQFNAAGFRVMVDDFGSGYSSLNMLMDMPVSTLKIDMEFIREVGTSERSNTLVSSVIRMAHWLEMTVVAEGVETETQLNYLRAMGCNRVQGYYFAKPMPLQLFYGLLERSGGGGLRDEEELQYDAVNVTEMWETIARQDRLLGGQMGAMCILEVAGSMIEIIAANSEYYQILGVTPDRFSRNQGVITDWLCEEDQETYYTAVARARHTAQRQDIVVQRYVDAEQTDLLLISIGYLGQKGSCFLYSTALKKLPMPSGLLPPAAPPAEEDPVLPLRDGERRPKVLIVEDNWVNRAMLSKILSEKYEVLEATNGRTGLRLLERDPEITAVLLDLIMPVMDGFQFLTRKRENAAVRDVPVLVLSQAESKQSELEAKALGADSFVRKPYDPVKLREQLETLQRGRQPPRE